MGSFADMLRMFQGGGGGMDSGSLNALLASTNPGAFSSEAGTGAAGPFGGGDGPGSFASLLNVPGDINSTMQAKGSTDQALGGVQTGLDIAQAIPGPQQPFVVGGNMLFHLGRSLASMFGGK